MAFPVGATVVVLAFGRKRGVVTAIGRSGHYRVQVEGLTMSCREEDLASPAASPRALPRTHTAPERTAAAAAPPARIDLHGLTVEDAIERVTQAIDRALLHGADRIEVVHGKGSGRLRNAVHRLVASLPVVSGFRLDPRNPGATWVSLR